MEPKLTNPVHKPLMLDRKPMDSHLLAALAAHARAKGRALTQPECENVIRNFKPAE